MEPARPKGLGMKGRRWITLVSAMLCSAAVIAVAAVPASARVPGGQGLGIFGLFECGDPLGEVEVFGAPAVEAANAYLIDTEGTGPHVVATRFRIQVCCGRGVLREELRQEGRPDYVQLHADGRPGGCLHPDGRGCSRALGGWTGPLRRHGPAPQMGRAVALTRGWVAGVCTRA